jgi:hypothetical protein
MADTWLWGDGADLLWGDGTSMGEDGPSLLSTGTTWNPDDIGTGLALSNGDLTAAKTGSAISRSGRATTSKTTGKKYFEVTADGIATDFNLAAVCLAESTADLLTYFGRFTDSVAYYGDGSVYNNDAIVVSLAAYVQGATVGLAVDLDAGKAWFRDGSGSFGAGDPTAGTGEHFSFTPGTAYFPGFTVNDNSPADIVTANFGATAFAHTVPDGFLGWDEEEAAEEAVALPVLTYGAGRLSPARVRAKYEEIEAIERHIRAKEEAEREKVRKQEEAKRQLAELEEKKRQTKTIAERRRKLEARIAAYQSDIADLRTTILVLMDEIERARVETELQQTIADRRRRMLLMIAAAA